MAPNSSPQSASSALEGLIPGSANGGPDPLGGDADARGDGDVSRAA